MSDVKEKNGADSEQELNPGQAHFDREFNGIAAGFGASADSGAENDNIRRAREGEKGGSLFNADGEKASGLAAGAGALSIGGLATAEAVGNGFNPASELKDAFSLRKKLLGSRRRRAATAGGGITGLLIGGGFLGFTIISGPLQFIHFAQQLSHFHFAAQSDAQDGRLSKEMRFYRYASRGEVERTRLGIIGNHYANTYEAKLNSQGLESAYTDKFGGFDGYVIDQSAPQFKNLSPDERVKLMKEKYGVEVKDGKLIKGSSESTHGKLVVDMSKASPRQQRAFTRAILAESGDAKLSASIGARLMGKRYGVTWHPIKKIDRAILRSTEARLKAWRENRVADVNEGAGDSYTTRDGSGDADPKATPEQKQAAADAKARAAAAKGGADVTISDGADTGNGIKSGDPGALSGFKEGLSGKLVKGVGGVGAVTGIMCLLQGVAKNADDIKQAQVIAPLVRMGVEMTAVGNQVMSGQGVDLEQLSRYSKLLYGKDRSGNMTSWTQAESVQAEQGQSGGTKPDDTLNTLSKGSPFDFLLSGTAATVLSGACNTAVQVGIGLISFLGGPFATIAGLGISTLVLPKIVDYASHYLAGHAVDAFQVGADFGNYVNFGAFLAAGDQALAAGGTVLTAAQALAVDDVNNESNKADFASHNIAYKVFSPTDSRSLFASMIDGQNPNVSTNVASLATSFTGVGQSIFKSFGSLFTGRAHAASAYNYGGMPRIGFDPALLADKRFENPYQNAGVVGGVFDNPDGSGDPYIEKAKNCLGDTISKDAGGTWNVTSARGASPKTSDFKKYDCASQDETWLRVRMFVLDTESMAPMACLAGDGQSCSDVGFDSGSPSATTATVSTGATVDQSTLFQDSSTVPCAAGTTDVGVHPGYHDGNLVNIKLCALPNMPSQSAESQPGSAYYVDGANGNALVNARVSGSFYNLVQGAAKDGVIMKAESSYRTMAHQQAICSQNTGCSGGSYKTVAKPGTSNHQMGLAIDFAKSNGATAITSGDQWFQWLTKNASDYGIKNYPVESWHWSATGN